MSVPVCLVPGHGSQRAGFASLLAALIAALLLFSSNLAGAASALQKTQGLATTGRWSALSRSPRCMMDT